MSWTIVCINLNVMQRTEEEERNHQNLSPSVKGALFCCVFRFSLVISGRVPSTGTDVVPAAAVDRRTDTLLPVRL